MKKFLGRIATAALCIPAAFGLFSCLSTESVTEPVEPALVVENATLPDGTVVSVQLFATGDEVQAWWKQLHPEQLHAKYKLTERDRTTAQEMRSVWSNSVDWDGYFKNEYSAAEFGELATIMQENLLRYGRGELFIGTELRSIYFSADKKYKKFFFLRVDYLDEEGVKKLQAIEEEEKAAKEALSKEIANAISPMISASLQAKKESAANQAQADAEYRQSIADAQSKVESQRAAQKQNNAASNKSYLAARFSAFANEAMQKELARNISAGEAALIRSKYSDKGSKSVSDAELNRYEKLLEQGYPKENAARTVFNEFRM